MPSEGQLIFWRTTRRLRRSSLPMLRSLLAPSRSKSRHDVGVGTMTTAPPALALLSKHSQTATSQLHTTPKKLAMHINLNADRMSATRRSTVTSAAIAASPLVTHSTCTTTLRRVGRTLTSMAVM